MPVSLEKNPAFLPGRKRRRVNAATRLDRLLREARCLAKPGEEREVLERLVRQEVLRMRGRGENVETIEDFQAAAAVHLSPCDPEAAD